MWTHFCTWMPRSHTHTIKCWSGTPVPPFCIGKIWTTIFCNSIKFSTTKKKTYFQRSHNKQWIIVRCLRNLWLCVITKQIISSLCLKLWINYYSSSTEPSEEQINIQTHRFKSSPGKKRKEKEYIFATMLCPTSFSIVHSESF